jgi:FkbM family methyltransferase
MTESKAKQLAQRIRSLMPAGLRRRVGRLGNYLTADMQGSIAFPSIELSLGTLRSLGFSPATCVDVGAYHGEWTRLFKSVFPDSRVLMVEAQDSKRDILQRVTAELGDSVRYQNALLSAREDDVVTFYEMETGSSLFEETSPYPRVAVEKRTRTLDSVLSEHLFARVDMLKLDVQGAELEVLKGAERALSQTEVLLMETSLMPVNAGSPTFAEVIEFVAARGFRLFDFCSQVRRTDGVLWQTDLLFVRSGSRVWTKPELTRENWG